MGKKKKKGGGGGGDGAGSIGYGVNKQPLPSSGLLDTHHPVSLRQQTGARVPGGAAQAVNPSTLRAEHLLRIATWASANVPPLGALLGARLGCLSEAAGVPLPETPHSICERCESIMQVGVNCSVRVTKNKRGKKSRKTEKVCNYVTYICHFCHHGNAKPGTSKSHLKTKISQVAARANLEMLGKSAVTQISSVDKKTSGHAVKKPEDPKHVQISEEKGEVANSVVMTIDEVAKSVDMAIHEVAKAVDMASDEVAVCEVSTTKTLGMALDKVEDDGAKVVDVTLDEVAKSVEVVSTKAERECAIVAKMTIDEAAKSVESTQMALEQEGANVVDLTLEEVQAQEGAKADEVAKPVEVTLEEVQAQEGAKADEAANPVEVTLEEVQAQEGAKADEAAKPVEVTLEEVEVQEGPRAVEMNLGEVPLDQGLADQEYAKAVDKGPLDQSQEGFTKQEDPRAAEMTPPLELMEESQQGVAHQEAEEIRPLDLTKPEDPRAAEMTETSEKSEQGVAKQAGPEAVEPRPLEEDLNKEPLEKSQQGQEGLKPGLVEITRKTLDTGKKKKRKKNNHPEQEVPKEAVVETSESSKKKKRKGWSTLKELAGVPQ